MTTVKPRRGPLRHPEFQRIIVGQIASNLGDLVYAVAFPWLVLSDGGGAGTLGGLLASFGVARIVGVVLGGRLSDRRGPRSLMVGCDLVRAALVLLIPAAVSGFGAGSGAMYALLAAMGLTGGLFIPASYSLLPAILPGDELAGGNAISSVATQSGTLIGPVVGGALVAGWGVDVAFYLDAGTFLVSATAVYLTHPRQPVSEDNASASVRALLGRGSLLWAVLSIAIVGNSVYAGAAEVGLPSLAREDFGSSGYAGFLLSLGVGLVLGGAAARATHWNWRPAFQLAVLGVWMGLAIALVSAFGSSIAVGLCLGAFGLGNGWSGVILITLVQRWAPPALIGRVMSLLMLAMLGVFPLSVLVAGALLDVTGPRVFFAAAGGLIVLASTVSLLARSYRDHGEGQRFAGAVAEALR